LNNDTMPAAPSAFLKSATNWQLVFVLIMLAAGYLSIAVSQIALGLALLVMLYRWIFLKEAPPATGLEAADGRRAFPGRVLARKGG